MKGRRRGVEEGGRRYKPQQKPNLRSKSKKIKKKKNENENSNSPPPPAFPSILMLPSLINITLSDKIYSINMT